jgi:hypothetical protein
VHCAGVQASTRVAAARTAATPTTCTARTHPSKKTSWASTERLVCSYYIYTLCVFTFGHVRLVIIKTAIISRAMGGVLKPQNQLYVKRSNLHTFCTLLRQNIVRSRVVRPQTKALWLDISRLMDASVSILNWRFSHRLHDARENKTRRHIYAAMA